MHACCKCRLVFEDISITEENEGKLNNYINSMSLNGIELFLELLEIIYNGLIAWKSLN